MMAGELDHLSTQGESSPDSFDPQAEKESVENIDHRSRFREILQGSIIVFGVRSGIMFLLTNSGLPTAHAIQYEPGLYEVLSSPLTLEPAAQITISLLTGLQGIPLVAAMAMMHDKPSA